ncbi:MAG: helix-turn-helix transcriptional regulator [Bacteroidota bacterium]
MSDIQPSGRIRIFRKSLKMTQKEFSDSIKLNHRTYASYESGQSDLRIKVMKDLLMRYGINLNWLIGGVGDMTLPTREGGKIEITATPEGWEHNFAEIDRPETEIERIVSENKALKSRLELTEESLRVTLKALDNNQFMIDLLRSQTTSQE